MAKIEEELALIIRSQNPEAVANSIAAQTKIGRYELIPQPALTLTDVYYDTFSGSIKSAKSSLRIRRIDDGKKLKTFVTVKGGNFSLTDSSKRIEHEFEWPQTFGDVKPEEVFKLFELKPHQVRRNYRRPRLVKDTKNSKIGVFAELVIDDFTYEFKSGKKARLFEVEIELKSKNPDAEIEEVAVELRKHYPNSLRTWKHSKLSMGKLIEVALDIDTDKNDILKDSAFDAIGRIL